MPLTSDQALAHVNRLYGQLDKRRRETARLEAYFRGEQKLAFASPEWREQHAQRYKGFADNWCSVVGSTPAERTEVIGFRLQDGPPSSPRTDDEAQLWADWETNDLPAQSSQGFLTSTVAKRSAVLVWGDADDEPEVTWEHPSQVIVDYQAGGRRAVRALKSWAEDSEEHATLYTADEVWKFTRRRTVINGGQTASGLFVPSSSPSLASGGWAPRQDADDDTWPIENPLGVLPVVEFLNRPMLGGEPLSDIEGTIAMQDAINLLWAYLFVAADYASMPARVVLGQEPPKIPILDANGQKVGERPVDSEALTRGRMLWLTGQSTQISQWDAAKLDVFTDVIHRQVRHIAAQTRTPMHLIHGELGNVNGETLTGLDAPLVSKVGEAQRFYRSPVQEVFRRMALVRSNTALADQCRRGTPAWRNPETRSDAQVSDAALKDRQVGWPFRAVLERRYGLGQEEVDRYAAMAEAEASDPLAASLLRGADAQGG